MQTIETKTIIPKLSHIETSIQVIEKKKSLEVFWKNKGGGQHPRPMNVPKKIKINEEIIAILGFFLGDGLRSSKGASSRTLSFTNSEPETVKWAIKLFKLFKIPERKLRATVSVRGKQSKNTIRKFWSRVTKIPEEQISVNICTSLSKNIRKSPPLKKYGAIKVEFYSAVLRDIFINFLEHSKNYALRNKKYSMAFLKGLLAAEGCPVINHGKLVNVVISCQNEKDKNKIENIIRNCRLDYNIWKDGIVIYKSNFIKSKNHDIFEFHPERQNRFVTSLLA